VDVSLRHPDDSLVRPWRLAAIVAVGVAAVELLLLVIVGGALIAKPAKPGTHRPAKAKAAAATSATSHRTTPVKIHRTAPPPARLARRKVTVLVLNGNGRHGAAAAAAARVSHRGYRIGGVANAGRTDFTRSLVMYRRGFEGEGRRLARDLGIGIVGPLDGIKTSQLHGANAVLVVGA
jgi:LytR cell envelope-related transcriptional attenuator